MIWCKLFVIKYGNKHATEQQSMYFSFNHYSYLLRHVYTNTDLFLIIICFKILFLFVQWWKLIKQHQEMQRKNEIHKQTKKKKQEHMGFLIYSVCTNDLSPIYEKKDKGWVNNKLKLYLKIRTKVPVIVWYKHWSWHFKGFKDYGRKGHLNDSQKWLHLTKREKGQALQVLSYCRTFFPWFK